MTSHQTGRILPSMPKNTIAYDWRKVMEEAEARRAKALAMHRAGKTYQEIAAALKVTRQRAHMIVQKALQAVA